MPLIFTTEFIKTAETFYHKIEEKDKKFDFEVVVTTTKSNQIAPGHEGEQHTFYFKHINGSYKFSKIKITP